MDSPEVLLARIEERQKSQDTNLNAKLDAILKQVTATNGRVTKLEDERLPKLEHWKSRMTGVWIALTIITTAVITIVEFILH